MGMRDFTQNITLLLLLPDMWILECVLLNESIPRPGQVLEMVPTDSYYVVFCVKLALFHLHYLPLVLIQVQVAKMLFSDRASRIYYVFVCLFFFFLI